MAILEVTETEVLQQCAACNTENRISLSTLEVGVARENQADARVIPLPGCPQCHSVEFLIRSPDDEPEYPTPGGFGHMHRMLVDHLHAELVKANKVNPHLRGPEGHADPAIARPLPASTRERWFPKGMKISLPAPGRLERVDKGADK